MAMASEPMITVNGQALTPVQAMTVRNALGCLGAFLLEDDALGSDDHGRIVGSAFQRSIQEIQGIIGQEAMTRPA
jgi:hypothetical protein